MNDAFLVGVLDSLANLDEQVEPFACGKFFLVTVFGYFDPAHQLHDEVGAARGSDEWRVASGKALTPSPSPIRWARAASGPLSLPSPLNRLAALSRRRSG